MDTQNHSMSSVLQDLALRIPMIRILVLTSMLLQLLLVVCGARRYVSSSSVLRSVVWIAYISADAVAILTLGTMMHNARNEMYGVWAPLLLLHLGGPDAITAYSIADNELWLRHGYNMVYQVSVAVYVMYVSSLKGWSLISAILLLIAGAIKYAERTAALRFASYSQIVKSTQPIYKIMQFIDEIDSENYRYLIMGEKELHHELMVVVREGLKGWSPSILEGKGIVTINDVIKDKGLQERDYTLCLSHALFKMYKRRFVSLYFHEGLQPKIRTFLLSLTSKEAFRIVEMELKFTYDVLFSKSSGTAFSMWGALVRLLNTILLGVACFLLFSGLRGKQYRQAQRAVTYVLIAVALVVEVYQLCRIMVSDWTRVRFICAHVLHSRHPSPQSCIYRCRLRLLEISMLVLRKFQNRYWKNRIQQYCLIQTCFNSSPYVWKVAGVFQKPDSFIVSWYIKAKHINTEPIQDDFRDFIFEILKARCSPEQDIEACRQQVYNFEKYLLTGEFEVLLWAAKLGLEEAILAWHIATTICEMQREELNQNENEKEKENVRFSRTLSRYCAYLLVSQPNLLPVHADIARVVYMEVHFELVELVNKYNRYKDAKILEHYKKESVLGYGTKLASQLMVKQQEQRWKFLAEYWAGLLIYIALYNKATFHAECVATGGEFVSQLWVLLGHMGCGEQSDSAVTKKMEDKTTKENEEDNKKRREKKISEIGKERMLEETAFAQSAAIRAAGKFKGKRKLGKEEEKPRKEEGELGKEGKPRKEEGGSKNEEGELGKEDGKP